MALNFFSNRMKNVGLDRFILILQGSGDLATLQSHVTEIMFFHHESVH